MDFKSLLSGKKTYLVVIMLMCLNLVAPDGSVKLDLVTIKENLMLGVVATARAAVQKVEDEIGKAVA